ncbi:hypothetical protein ACJA3J_18665 [Halobacillus sp. SY10]|uniref:hypothetical protein n=1 Tax=Halobacillus sp. SY10 TaxID=3381356 RepID=UPI0038791B78
MMNMTTETGTRASVHIQPIEMKKVTFTSTPYTTSQIRYQSMKNQYNFLLNKAPMDKEDVDEFRSMVNALITELDQYEEGLFMLRKIQKQLRKQQKKHETKAQSETLEDFLINKKLMNFINIGALGRKWVAGRLDEKKLRRSSEGEITEQVNKQITRLNDKISLIKKEDNKEILMSQLSELDIAFDNDLLAEKVMEGLLLEDLSDVNTLSDLNKRIVTMKNDIEEAGIVDSTFEEQSIEKLHHSSEPTEK